jgi:hypothetical protein
VIDDAGEKTLQLSRLFGKIKVGYKQR